MKNIKDSELVILHQKSHDLKNHLMSMRGYLHILSKKLQKEPELLSFITTIDSKIEKIGEISTEMVDIASS